MVRYIKYTDDKLEEHEFTFMLMSRQYKSLYDVNLLNRELENRMQEQEINQSIFLSNVNLSQYSVETHFKTKIHLCKVNGITKEGIITKDIYEDITEDDNITKDDNKTKDNNKTKVNNKTKDITEDEDITTGYCKICNIR